PPAIVLWHGLGDRYNSDGMAHVAELVARLLPGTYVHSIYVDETPALDERRSLFGDANRAVDLVCAQLSNITELSLGFGAIGFSQGGLFLRALIQRCPSIAVSKLVTFGSPHMGVLELPVCQPPDDWVCRKRNQLLKAQVWQDSVQKTVVPAQYFRDPGQYERYLEHSNFLAAVNNERPSEGSRAAKRRFERLQKLVLIKFAHDSTLVPKESAFFQERHGLTGQEVPMTGTRVYRDNLFGLRTLHEAGRIEFHTVDDEHMQFSDDFFLKIVSDHF
ncbi:alpha/beta-hydrolase, partial [Metschnikowia bicuspidata var. bicuspidata NRRL YB-4993]